MTIELALLSEEGGCAFRYFACIGKEAARRLVRQGREARGARNQQRVFGGLVSTAPMFVCRPARILWLGSYCQASVLTRGQTIRPGDRFAGRLQVARDLQEIALTCPIGLGRAVDHFNSGPRINR
jgi:hypothetical protein